MPFDRPLVLIVDDDPSTRALLGVSLNRAGFAVADAASGEEALEILARAPVGAVVLDLELPGMSGIEVIEALRRQPKTRTLPLLMMTGSADEGIVLRAFGAGANDFVVKPVQLDELVARIRAHMRTSDLWSDQIEDELRARADLVRSMGAQTLPADPAAAAAMLISQISLGTDVEFVSLLQVGDQSQVEALATFQREIGLLPRRPVPSTIAPYLLARVRDGPWLEIVGSSERALTAEAFGRGGPEIAAMAPIRAGERLVGILVLGASQRPGALAGGRPARLLASAIDLAATVSTVAGSIVALHPAEDEHRVQIELVVETRAFYPVFQPIVSLVDRVPVGHEALTRFLDGTPPAIRFAEAAEVGLGLELETVTIDAALRASTLLPNHGWLAVNVSPDLLLDEDRMASLLASTERPIVVEVTEHARIDDYARLRDALERHPGRVRVSVDDAGAGYASLRHILELRPSFVKLDLSIVRGIESDPVRQALVSGLVFFVARLEAALIAEGVETEAEAGALAALGIELGQGFLFGHPAAVELLGGEPEEARID